jgi:hypothetical protein
MVLNELSTGTNLPCTAREYEAWFVNFEQGYHPGPEQYSLAWVFMKGFVDSR